MDSRSYMMLQETFAMLVCFGGLGWVIYLGVGLLRRRQQHAMQKHTLDKFSSAQDFSQFIQSPAGQKYMMSFTDEVTSPRSSILDSVKIGLVSLFAGAALKAAGIQYHISFVDIVGWLFAGIGAGYLCSAVISFFLANKINAEVRE